jgi:hypothetical protein
MVIIGCDYHPSAQQIALVDTDTGELKERRLGHRDEAEQFYRELRQQNRAVRAGMESSGHSRWYQAVLSPRRAPSEFQKTFPGGYYLWKCWALSMSVSEVRWNLL